MSKRKPPTPPPFPRERKRIEFETFHGSIDYWLENLSRAKNPSAFNSEVKIQKFRIICEPIEEPKEVLAERLKRLWRETPYNSHLTGPFKQWAKHLGIELEYNDFGKDAKKS